MSAVLTLFQDLEGRILDRSRALWIYRELERVEGFLDNLRLFDAIPQRVIDQAREYCQVVHQLRDTVWRLTAPEPLPPAGVASSVSTAGGAEASAAVADVDLDQLAQSVPSRAIAGPTGRRRRPSAGTAPQSKAQTSVPRRAPR